MTREETKEPRIVMQHFEDGGEIEVINRFDIDDTWQKTSKPAWNWSEEKYRIKPKSIKVTEEERKVIKDGLVWLKDKELDDIIHVASKVAKFYKDNFYILNPETMEWEDWSGDTERLRHHYNGGQP